MPDFMLLLHRPAEAPPTLSPEQIAAMIEDYSGWAGRLRAEGRIKAGEKLTQDAGRVMSAQRGRITGRSAAA